MPQNKHRPLHRLCTARWPVWRNSRSRRPSAGWWVVWIWGSWAIWSAWAWATPIDQMRNEATQMEQDRDCEGAYKKYDEIQQKSQGMPDTRNKRSLLAFVATKMANLKPCYEKCNPTPEELELLKKAEGFRTKGESKRAYRILLRLLRGKNPRCTTWKQAHEVRQQLSGQIPTRRRTKTADPCEMEDATRQELTQLKTRIDGLKNQVDEASAEIKDPPPPAPPRWARTERQKKRWLQRWKQQMRRKRQRHIENVQQQRLRRTITTIRTLNELREKVFELREDFQNCDSVYTDLRTQGNTLRASQQQAHQSVVNLYDTRIKKISNEMRWFARQYWQNKKNQKTDNQTMQSLRDTLERQREFIDNVSKDLLTLSTLLVFKTGQSKEGGLLDNSAAKLQELMTDQQKLVSALQTNYPQYLQSSGGRRSLRQHLASLENFQRVLERFQDQQTGEKSEQIGKTLQAVRSSILLLEKAEENLAKKPETSAPGQTVMSATAQSPSGQPTSSRSPWGWLLLLSGVLLGGVAAFFIWRDKNKGYEKI